MIQRCYVFFMFIVMLGMAAPLAAQTVHGRVIDALTKQGIPGAVVRVDSTRLATYTKLRGRFEINVTNAVTIRPLTVTAIGYDTAHVALPRSPSDTVLIELNQVLIDREAIVVSANKRVQAVQDVPISVAVMKSQDLQQRAIVRLDDALKYVSGVSVVKDQVNIRGASGFALGVGSRTAVLIDGFSLLSGDNGDIKFDVLPVMDVERIEVVKGAGSALYGTGALGGVVSMHTKRPTEEFSLNARVYGGIYTGPPFDRWKYLSYGFTTNSGADIRCAQSVGQFSYTVSGGYRNDQAYRAYDGAVRGYGFAKAGYEIDATQRLQVNVFHAQDKRQNYLYWKDLRSATSPSAAQILDEYVITNKTAAGIEYTKEFDQHHSLIARYGYFRTGFAYIYNNDSNDPTYSTSDAHSLDLQHTALVTEALVLTSGITARLNFVNSVAYGNTAQSIFSGYSQAEYRTRFGAIVTLGARLDREATLTLGDHLVLSPKAGMSWPVTEDLTIRTSTGRGFRAPTIAERYANIQYGPFKVKPNLGVQAEYSWSSEVGANWKSRQPLPMEFDIAVFDNELFSLIEPTFDLTSADIPIVFTNLTRARILGAEITGRIAFAKGLFAETGLTLMNPMDLTQNTMLKYRNKVLWYSRASWTPLPWLEVQGEYRYQDSVQAIDNRLALFVTDADVRVPVHVVDARVFARVSESMRVGLIGRNVFNYAYVEAVGNLGPTRSVMLQVEYR